MAATATHLARSKRAALLGVGLLMFAACGSGTDAASQSSDQSPTSTSNATQAACPDQPIKITGPDDWHMTKNFSGQQTWEGTATVTNPNSADVQVIATRSFALVTVTRADGSTYTGYTGPLTSVLPAGGRDALVLAGKTIEMVTSAELIRPASVATTQAYLDVVLPLRTRCTIPLEGAQPPTTAARGPHICNNGLDIEGPPNIDIGLRQTQDQPACT